MPPSRQHAATSKKHPASRPSRQKKGQPRGCPLISFGIFSVNRQCIQRRP
jgi:hypothetical protein